MSGPESNPAAPSAWFIVRQTDGTCQITTTPPVNTDPTQQVWGPYDQEADAIARRVGLIRSGQCLPV